MEVEEEEVEDTAIVEDMAAEVDINSDYLIEIFKEN